MSLFRALLVAVMKKEDRRRESRRHHPLERHGLSSGRRLREACSMQSVSSALFTPPTALKACSSLASAAAPSAGLGSRCSYPSCALVGITPVVGAGESPDYMRGDIAKCVERVAMELRSSGIHSAQLLEMFEPMPLFVLNTPEERQKLQVRALLCGCPV